MNWICNLKKRSLSIVIILLLTNISGFSINGQNVAFREKVIGAFTNHSKNTLQEKLYLQTDKPYYSAGDTIWFKGYLLDAQTHTEGLSKYIYAELVNISDSVLVRVKIKAQDQGFYGHIPLSEKLAPSNYALRAYSWFMQNEGTPFFFHKIIPILNNIDTRADINAQFSEPVNNKVKATFSFQTAGEEPFKDTRVSFFIKQKNGVDKELETKTNQQGKVEIDIPLENLPKEYKNTVSVILDPRVMRYQREFFLPEAKKEYDFQLFPESGSLIPGAEQIVAFKVTGTNGLSQSASGTLYDNNNQVITSFKTINKGMGQFAFTPEAEKQYFVEVLNQDGLKKRIDLPQVQTKGIGLRISPNMNLMSYQINNQSDISPEQLYLIAHQRGKLLMVNRLNSESLSGNINMAGVPSGIITFTIIDENGQPYCQRLYYVDNMAIPFMTMELNKEEYTQREQVKMKLQAFDSQGKPFKGKLSIAVTDSKVVANDTLSADIRSYLLMTSDLVGHIESPNDYFNPMDPLSIIKRDLLMKTQGWRRFDIQTVLKNDPQPGKYDLEIGQTISGYVRNAFDKPYKNASLVLFSTYKRQMLMASADEKGHYEVAGIEFPDSVTFMVNALSRKGKKAMVVNYPKKEVFPSAMNTFIPPILGENIHNSMREYMQMFRQKFYTENGERVVQLEDVIITGRIKGSSSYIDWADRIIDENTLNKYENWGLLDLIEDLYPGQLRPRGTYKGSPVYILDGIEQTADDTMYITGLIGMQIQNVEIYTGSSGEVFATERHFSSDNKPCAVVWITTKKNVGKPSPGMAIMRFLGYQKDRKFYTPKYTPNEPQRPQGSDLRSTIYWNPEIALDENGVVELDFYSADRGNSYNVIVEGVSNTGEILRFDGFIPRRMSIR